ncbi:MAG: tryptophan 7-halogenase [Planctomycetota bacterium]
MVPPLNTASPDPLPQAVDVLVIGAGPAGATAAALLAEAGFSVLVLEKDHFPREKIGESLLPAVRPVLARLGIAERPDAFLFKRGARFVCEDTNREGIFAFADALAGGANSAWHVDRALFDTILRDRARELGAEVRHGWTVTDAGADRDHAWVETRTNGGAKVRVRGRYLIDSSGLSRLMARRCDAVQPYEQFGHCSVYTHFRDADLDELRPDHDIRIMLRKEGWGWVIPLPGDRLSVGIVAARKIDRRVLDEGLLAGPLVRRLTSRATRLETHTVGNFSFVNTAPSGPRFAATGDAACFIDPVFSSGVTLALRGAVDLVDHLLPALREGREADPTLLDEHLAGMRRACATFAGLVERFYHTNFAESYFLGGDLGEDFRRGVMSVLAGDVWRTDNAFQEMLLRARRRPAKGPSTASSASAPSN